MNDTTKGLVRKIHKGEFAKELAARTGLKREQAEQVTAAFLEILAENWHSHTPVMFQGFGSFEARPTPARMGRNLSTMEEVPILAGYKPVFRPSKQLLDRINDR